MKEWFILVDGKQEGPYNLWDLKQHPGLTPDTLVWKDGFEQWIPIRHVPELQDLFKDEPEGVPVQDLIQPKIKKPDLQQEDTLTLETDPSPFLFLLIILLVIISYFIFYFNQP